MTESTDKDEFELFKRYLEKDEMMIEYCNQAFGVNQLLRLKDKHERIEKYNNSMVYSAGLLRVSNEIYWLCHSLYGDPDDNNEIYFVLSEFLNTGTLVYEEACILIQYGSAQGALARWRTLYELAVYSEFILKYPNSAVKYLEQFPFSAYKLARRLHEKLGDIDEKGNRYSDLLEAKNASNIKSEFDWAREAFGKKTKIDFNSIAKKTSLYTIYAPVDEANIYNHASPRYIFGEEIESYPEFSTLDLDYPFGYLVNVLALLCSTVLKLFEQKTDLTDESKEKIQDYQLLLNKIHLKTQCYIIEDFKG
ncbi:MAG: DUF5677 domain-containing protein [Methanosarcinales archaeon]|jgi:hypothetical protein|nr:DUF5677 domain-containing protein [Methanosarcinales archaeon]